MTKNNNCGKDRCFGVVFEVLCLCFVESLMEREDIYHNCHNLTAAYSGQCGTR